MPNCPQGPDSHPSPRGGCDREALLFQSSRTRVRGCSSQAGGGLAAMPPIHLTPTVRLPENGAGRIRVCWGQAAGGPPPLTVPAASGDNLTHSGRQPRPTELGSVAVTPGGGASLEFEACCASKYTSYRFQTASPVHQDGQSGGWQALSCVTPVA